jgi:hypothetical protein
VFFAEWVSVAAWGSRRVESVSGSVNIEGQTSKSAGLFWCLLEHRASADMADCRRRFAFFSFVRSETWDETL